ncbi:hypothetical protein tb265_33180 [Gemmatimonadetes bacterium T265]|nr:hypothetical protein tb265_33180 [Gemmatimonadetes bacterium T265]
MNGRQWIRRRRTACFGLAAVVSANACYTFVPVRDGIGANAGDAVELELSDAGAARLTPVFGPRVRLVTGRVTSAGDSGVVVAVAELARGTGGTERWNGDTVRFARTDVSQLSRQQLARGTTIVLVAAGAAGVILGGRALGGSNGGTKTGTNVGRQ